jgi:molybdopterin synthase catalytic subunit
MGYLTDTAIDLAELISAVQSPSAGGIASFVGVVRDQHQGRAVDRLEYSAYGAMAEQQCADIVAEAERRWPVRVALHHRVGRLEVGDVAVAMAAASAHRNEAFAACRYVIEEVKRRVPIWKKEFYRDGAVEWVDPTAAGAPVPASEGRTP